MKPRLDAAKCPMSEIPAAGRLAHRPRGERGCVLFDCDWESSGCDYQCRSADSTPEPGTAYRSSRRHVEIAAATVPACRNDDCPRVVGATTPGPEPLVEAWRTKSDKDRVSPLGVVDDQAHLIGADPFDSRPITSDSECAHGGGGRGLSMISFDSGRRMGDHPGCRGILVPFSDVFRLAKPMGSTT
jgi:hypothetical protein